MKFESFGKASVRTGYIDRSIHINNPFEMDKPFQVSVVIDDRFTGAVKPRGRFVPKKSDSSKAFIALKVQLGVNIVGVSYHQCQNTGEVIVKIDLEIGNQAKHIKG